jgi:TonB-dependent starch-binding outer membrane protein SusC
MKRILILMGMLLFVSASLFGQQIRVTGTVTDQSDGSTLPGVTVIVKGTTMGAITDINGRYEITVAPTATLVFSFIGLRTVEIPVEGRTVISVALERDVFSVEEFVVVGYGIQQRRDISGAVSTVRGESIRNIPVQTFEQALQGKAAGVNITIPNAQLGNPPVIRVRGFNSISGSSSPLIVVDGVPVFTGDLSRTNTSLNVLGDINPADIESIEILKDASATAIYGSRAANGVILVTTRKGAPGKTTVTYDGSVGFTSPSRIYDMMNAEQFVAHKNLARANAGLGDVYFLNYDAAGNLIDTDWNDVVYQNAMQQNHSVTFSGASPTTRYFASIGYSNSDGIVKTNSYERTSARLNVEHRLNKAIQLSASFSYTNSFSTAPTTGSLPGGNFATAGLGRVAFLYAPNVPLYVDAPVSVNSFPTKDDPTKFYNIGGNNLLGTLNNTQGVGFFNPAFLLDYNYHDAISDRVLGNVAANVEFLPGLVFRTVFGVDNSGIESKTFWDARHGDGTSNNGLASNYFDRRNRWNWTNTLNYMTSIQDRLNLNFLVGSEEQYTVFNGWSGNRTNIADAFYTSYQGSFTTNGIPPVLMQTENYFTSFFGRVNLNFDQKYYVELSGRRDGFSGLAAGNKYGNFGGASVMWNLSREDFIRDGALGETFSDLRIKGSFGRVGNISGIANFGSLSLYGAGLYNGNSTLAFAQAGNPNLAWEASTKYDAGIAFGILDDRIQVELNYFYNLIDGLILDVPQAPSKGIPGNSIPSNIGSMFNTGLELSLVTYNIQTSDFSWNTTFNFSTLKNEVTALAPGVTRLIGVTALETTNRTVVGEPIGNIWGVETAGVDPATGRRIFINGSGQKVYYDPSIANANLRWTLEDGTVHRPINIDDDGKVLGSPIPRFYGGLDNNLTYRNFDLSIGLTFALDYVVYNGSKAGLRDQRTWNNTVEVYENAWKQPGDITDIPKPIWGDNISNGSTMVQSQNVEKADFLKVRNLSLGYRLDNQLTRNAGISSARIYVQMFNALVLTKYTGADPEISSMGDANLTPGVDRNTIPQARTISLGINVNF